MLLTSDEVNLARHIKFGKLMKWIYGILYDMEYIKLVNHGMDIHMESCTIRLGSMGINVFKLDEEDGISRTKISNQEVHHSKVRKTNES
jgi:hypothetical protein